MGILNITPDSFFDGGKFQSDEEMLNHVQKMITDGASIIDIGGQSTRPGAPLISAGDEWQRTGEKISLLRKNFPAAIFSVDTFYSVNAKRAVDAGADMINDISGGTMDPEMFNTIARLHVPYVLMHIKGTPQSMQTNPQYENVVREVIDYFAERINRLTSLGVTDILIDPGFGFGKTMEHNLELLDKLDLLQMMGKPVVAGLSRKSMITKLTGTTKENALNGTTVLNTIALMKGANILRVHDVKEAVEAVKIISRM